VTHSSDPSVEVLGMPWTETGPMNERIKFIAAYLEDDAPFSEICRDFGISQGAAAFPGECSCGKSPP
jgi:hypothetical protein